MRRPPAVARVLERVTATAREHAMFLPGQVVLVSVSGGPDSTCLLHALHLLQRLFRIRLVVFHFDHRLRRGSARDAAYVRRVSARLGLPFVLRVAEEPPRPRMSIEHWARDVRRAASVEAMREAGAERIALGHTANDQAETVLMAAITGSGLDAVAGIRPAILPWVHPLLDVTRREVEACCRALRLRPRQDPMNRDPRLLRNALRLRGIPALERAAGRDVIAALARTASLLREDAEELARQAAPAAAELIEETPEGVELPATALLDLPRALEGRVAREAILRCGVVPTREDVEAVLDLAAGRTGRRRDLSSGLKAARDRGYVRLSRLPPGA
ncbi:MAG TPA: tRNA lysidine(34) synthetase TilS [Actinomycetota bacterium]|nr:tRNA lysidine(34) synthetase TilS [Actinomycetota bacterium]